MNRSRRAQINRQNALKSTGPKTDEGKDRSRRNALKHGLRAETIALPTEDAADLQATLDEWTEHYGPDTPGERALVEQACTAQIQLHRCARFHAAAVGTQVRTAEERWEQSRADEVAHHAALLADDPATAVRRLGRTAHGCRDLIARWERLDAVLAAQRPWSDLGRDEAIRLLGLRPDRPWEDPDAYVLDLLNLLGHESPAPEAVALRLDPARMPDLLRGAYRADRLPDRATSRRMLRAIVAERLGPLRAEEARLRTTIDDPDRAGAADRALLLEGPRGSLLLRYQKQHELAFHRAYKSILQAQKVADAAADDLPACTPEPAAPNEASAAPRPPSTPCEVTTYPALPALVPTSDLTPPTLPSLVPVGWEGLPSAA